jgi:lysyl-tRNA synthetase class 2
VESVERFGDSRGKLLAEIFGAVAEKKLLQPTFVVDYPAEISPLSKTKPDDPDTADRFELFIGRMEVANGFCELNDPDEQAEKFRAQVAERGRGDDEAMLFDEDYVEALSYGMPPTAGEGIGIDRLAMLFTNSHSIRDVIFFPLMRPKKDKDA